MFVLFVCFDASATYISSLPPTPAQDGPFILRLQTQIVAGRTCELMVFGFGYGQSAVREFAKVEHGGLLVAASQSSEGMHSAVTAICTSGISLHNCDTIYMLRIYVRNVLQRGRASFITTRPRC